MPLFQLSLLSISVFHPTASQSQIRYLRQMISPWQWLFATLAGVLVAAAVVATTAKGRALSDPPTPLLPPNFRPGERDLMRDRPVVGRRVFMLDRQRSTAAAAVEDTPLRVSRSERIWPPGDAIGHFRREPLPP